MDLNKRSKHHSKIAYKKNCTFQQNNVIKAKTGKTGTTAEKAISAQCEIQQTF